MTAAAEMLARLRRWREQGWLRALDLAFAEFVHGLDAGAPASLLLATALLVHLEGQGHSSLPLRDFLADAPGVLAWPPEAGGELAEALALLPADGAAARAAWGELGVVEADPADDRGTSPLVLAGGRLALRRYWRHETRVAAQVLRRSRPWPASDPAALASITRREAARAWIERLFAPVTDGDGDHGGTGAGGDRNPDPHPDADTDAAAADAAAAGRGRRCDRPSDPDRAASNDTPATTPDWQRVACAVALRAPLTIVTGGPGTGKTYVAARLLVLLRALNDLPRPLRVALAAPTGKAAARLKQSIDAALSTLQQRLGDGVLQATLPGLAAPGPARTLHALLGTRPGSRRFVHDAANPLDVDLLFIDEASMVHLEMMDAVLDALPARSRLVLLGDRDQLASVEAGAVLGDLCAEARRGRTCEDGNAVLAMDTATRRWVHALTGETLPAAAGPGVERSPLAQQTVVLQGSRRFGGAIGALAAAVNRGDAAVALAMLHRGDEAALALVETDDPQRVAALAVGGRTAGTRQADRTGMADGTGHVADAADGPAPAPGYGDYLAALAARPADPADFDAWAYGVLTRFDRFRVLCAVRAGPWGVAGLNAGIERLLFERGLLARGGSGGWYEGRPVIVTRNDRALGVANGDVGAVLRAPVSGRLRACFLDAGGVRSVAVGRLAQVETAFAMTVHKSQGSEFAHVALVLPDRDAQVLTRELVYTGITRARTAFTLVARDAAGLARATGRLTVRLSGLRDLLHKPGPGA